VQPNIGCIVSALYVFSHTGAPGNNASWATGSSSGSGVYAASAPVFVQRSFCFCILVSFHLQLSSISLYRPLSFRSPDCTLHRFGIQFGIQG
jgi:hypothetical protein